MAIESLTSAEMMSSSNDSTLPITWRISSSVMVIAPTFTDAVAPVPLLMKKLKPAVVTSVMVAGIFGV